MAARRNFALVVTTDEDAVEAVRSPQHIATCCHWLRSLPSPRKDSMLAEKGVVARKPAFLRWSYLHAARLDRPLGWMFCPMRKRSRCGTTSP